MASRWAEVGLEEALCSESEAWHTFLSAEVADNWRPVLAEAWQEVGSSHRYQPQAPEAHTRPRGCRTPPPLDCTDQSNLWGWVEMEEEAACCTDEAGGPAQVWAR